ncbi:MAG TPA: hypothetical protein VJ487_09205, partial [Alphaproteobacteria bacterium]|nr:hypothetical protein [Alphaproteobacteria bacterium]
MASDIMTIPRGIAMVSAPVFPPVKVMKVSLVALTLNEVEGVKAILPRIRPEWYDQLVVVDGGSTDGTLEWCRAHGYEVFVQRR